MTKAEFITKVRENSELSKAQIDEVLTVILDTIVDSVKNHCKYLINLCLRKLLVLSNLCNKFSLCHIF